MAAKKKSAEPPKPSPNPNQRSVTPMDLLQYFRERWWIGLLVGLVAAAAFVFFQPEEEPVYRSEVTLLFETRGDQVLNVQQVVDTSVRNAEQLNTHMEQIRSRTFFEYVMASFTPGELERIRNAYRDPLNPDEEPPHPYFIIRPNVEVYNRRGTTIIGIAVTNRNPENAALIANRYARRYIEFNLDRSNTGTNNAIVFLRQQAEEKREEVEASERMLQRYRAEHNIASVGEHQNVIREQVGALGSTLVAAKMAQVEHRSILDKIRQYQRDGRDLLEIPQIASFGGVSGLRNQLDSLRAERVLLEERYLARHPKMIQSDLRIEEVRRQLNQQVQMAIADVEAQADIAASREQHLRAELAATDELARELDRVSSDYELLRQEAAVKNETYLRIVDRLNEASLASQSQNVNIKIFDPAMTPSMPANDSPGELIAKAGGLGLAMFLLVPLGLGFMDSRVKSVAQVENGLEEHVLGAVKRIKGFGEAERAHVFRLRKDDALSESYRGIYSEIELRSELRFPKILLLTSSIPGEGKSTTASNLAAVFASHGRRTLLVDCDLRRPTLHRFFGLAGDSGWLNWLRLNGAPGERPLPATYTVAEGFDVLPAGGSASKPTEMLDQLMGSGLLGRLQERYSLIILDTPPVAVFPDALLLAQHVAEVVYVCRFRAVRMIRMRASIRRLRATSANFLGVVMNQLPESRAAQYGYHGYGTEDTKYYKEYTVKSGAPA